VLFRIPYRRNPDPRGRLIDTVVLSVQFSLPLPNSPRTKRVECIVDSGASLCLFHADIATFLGIDLESGVREITQGIGGPEETWLHEILLHLPGGAIRLEAGFKRSLPVAGLLGMHGFFDQFRITFDPTARECTLARLYPG
jgi:hypothetical protein